ncbi:MULTISPECIES: GNAT family N-acetyltransferase [unclassified Luteococcus]|uniref:GNAT family N-acetyltransferase n=1 Tax=unclassified Luteococcus TaxID=2639923 RepID=UPI00313D6F6C
MPEPTKNLPGVSVRDARPQDLSAVRGLVLTSVREDHGLDYNPIWHADLDRAEDCYLRDPRAALLVAEAGEGIIGCGGVRPFRRRGPEPVQRRYGLREDVGELVRVAVLPRFRQNGLARQVCARLVNGADHLGYGVLTLHTPAVTPRSAVPFWRALGAVQIHDDRQDGLVDPAVASIYFEIDVAVAKRQLTAGR